MDKSSSVCMAVAQWINSGIAAKGVAVVDFADAVAIARPTLIRKLKGAPPGFTIDEAQRIADYFGVTINDLTGERAA